MAKCQPVPYFIFLTNFQSLYHLSAEMAPSTIITGRLLRPVEPRQSVLISTEVVGVASFVATSVPSSLHF